MHFDDAFDFLVETLAASPDATGLMGRNARNATYGNDVWLPKIAEAYWQPRMAPGPLVDLDDGHFRPFYDAAWELARIGVLRPGAFAPRGRAMGNELFSGDGFSITQFGREWLRCASNRPVRDPSRLADVLNAFAPKFGAGYPTSLWRPVRAIADRKATAMSAGTECSSRIHATAVSASCSLKGRPVSAEQRPAATNPVSGRGLGRQPGGSNTTDLAENEFGLLAAIVSLLREFGAAWSVAIGGLFGW